MYIYFAAKERVHNNCCCRESMYGENRYNNIMEDGSGAKT